jgi:hypothetical protein
LQLFEISGDSRSLDTMADVIARFEFADHSPILSRKSVPVVKIYGLMLYVGHNPELVERLQTIHCLVLSSQAIVENVHADILRQADDTCNHVICILCSS